MNELEVQIANESDFDGIKRVIIKHSQTPDIYYKPSPPSDPHDVVQNDRRVTIVAKSKNEIVAYLSLHSEKSFMCEDNDAEFEVVVDPDYRNRGIGQKLLRSTIQYAANTTRLKGLIAKIKKGNVPSERLCQNTGFILDSEETLGSIWRLNINR